VSLVALQGQVTEMGFQMLVPNLLVAVYRGWLQIRFRKWQIPLLPEVGHPHILLISLRDVDPEHEFIPQEFHGFACGRIILLIFVAQQV
jgi:hypothetical protein